MTSEKAVAEGMEVLTEHAREIASGVYKNVDRVFRLTDPRENSPEIAGLAESIGLMTVKVEAREFELEQTIEELREKKADLEKSIRAREEFSRIFIVFTLMIGLYSFALAIMSRPAVRLAYGPNLIPWAGTAFSFMMLAMAIFLIRGSGLPLSEFGVNLHNAGRAVRESLLASFLILGLAVLFKLWARTALPSFQDRPIFDSSGFNVFFLTYVVIAPIQEFCARGVFQSSVERTMCGPRRVLWAVITASVMFGVFHTFYSLPLAVTSMLGSFLWGWLYHRQGTLLGVAISHFLIGNGLGIIDIGLFLVN